MSRSEQALDVLQRCRLLSNEAEIRAFQHALAEVATTRDPGDLGRLYRLFDDGVEDYGLFWALLHAIEDYDWAAGATAFVAGLPETDRKAHEWMKILAIRQLNDDRARALLVAAAGNLAPDAVGLLTGLLREIGGEDDAVAERARSALAELATA